MRSRVWICLPIVALFIALLAMTTTEPSAEVDAEGARQRNADLVRGMTISCHRWGGEWGSDAMVEAMRELKALGVKWIAIHPYAGINRETGEVDLWDRAYRDTYWLTRPIEEAHKLGLKIFVKPHIAYWGSGFSWRGEIEFANDAQWDRFFDSYEQWITLVAELSKDADGFAVGTELDKTVQHEQQWRAIIAAVRAKTDAPLTYAANWDSYQRIKFWDALDVIGVQGYFPLVNHTELPSADELNRGWQRIVRELDEYARPWGKKVVLAELGYNESSLAAHRPWEYRTGGQHAEEIQRRCMAAALQALERQDRIVGAFLWKWFPQARVRRGNFLMQTPAMREVIREHWGEPLPANASNGRDE